MLYAVQEKNCPHNRPFIANTGMPKMETFLQHIPSLPGPPTLMSQTPKTNWGLQNLKFFR